MRRAIVVLLMGGVACGSAQQQAAPQALPPEAQRALVRYFECEECQSGELQAVVALGDSAVAPLAQVLREGPPSGSVSQLQQHLVAEYQQQANDAGARAAAVPPLNPAPPLSQDETVALYTDNYTRMYRTRAARALGAIGTANARAALTQAQSPSLPPEIQRAITQALGLPSR